MLTCASCGQENPAGARFCNSCAAPLAGDAPAAREERKVVTVLFADVVGFTARAEQMDPEDVRRFLQPLHARLRSELERHGGTVEKFIGDAVMAVFGAPVVHEDDPERAVRAALAILEALAEGGDMEVRIGITTGEALIALEARPDAGEGIASGDVVNTAARLQTAAPAGGILADAATYRASERTIEYSDAAPVVAKGKTEPVAVWQPLRARTALGVERPREAPLVGRMEERTLLRETLARVLRERESQLVTLVGVPGIGKSRLVAELLEEGRDDDRVLSLQGHSLPYGEGVTFWALGEMVKGHAGILESDTADGAAAKLSRVVTEVITEPADAARVERHLRPLAGLETEDIEAGDRRSEAFAAWRRFLEALAERRPLVLVFEDLHWADDDLLDFVDHLLDWATGVPILVLVTARPELLVRRPTWGGGTVNSSTIRLSALSDTETRSLLDELLGRSALSAEAHRTLLERAGGNPLYAQEFARMLGDRRGELTLPESIHGIIAARLDSLPRAEKELLQDGAVVGRVFWLGALGSERWRLEETLHSLERKEFVRRERSSSVGGEAEYTFSHALVRDVAYDQIPRSLRAAKHRAASEWIESLGRLEDHAEMLAHHYVQALDYADAAGEPAEQVAEQSLRAFREAGNRAFSLNAYPAASRYYERALAISPNADLLLSLAEAQARAGDMPAAKATYLKAADEARQAGSVDQLARAALGYGGRFVWARAWGDERIVPLLEEALDALPREDSDLRVRLLARLAAGPLRDTLPPEPREAMCREAVEIARRLDNPATLAYALDGLYCSNWSPDVLRERMQIAAELIEVAAAVGDAEREYAGRDHHFHGLIELGDIPAARRELETKTALAEGLGQPAQLWDSAAGRALLALPEGRLAEAEAATFEALELGRSAQTANAKVAFDLQIYALRREQGRLAEVVDSVKHAVDDYPAYPIWRYVLADVLAGVGERREAGAALDALAAEDFEIQVEMQWLASLSLLPEVCRYLGAAEPAERLYEALLPYARHNATTPPELYLGSVSRGLGILAAMRSDWDAAERHFEDALEMNNRMGARLWLAHTSYDYAHMRLRRDRPGDRERAHELAAAARALADELGLVMLSAKVTELLGSEASVR